MPEFTPGVSLDSSKPSAYEWMADSRIEFEYDHRARVPKVFTQRNTWEKSSSACTFERI